MHTSQKPTTTTTTTTTILLLFLPKRKIYVCPANSQKASHGGASRYKNNFNKNKLSCKPLTENLVCYNGVILYLA